MDNNVQSTVEELIQTLKSGDGRASWQACQALISIGSPAVEPLITLLDNDDSEVRFHTTALLARIGDNCAIEPLIEALSDSDSQVRYWVAFALGRTAH